VITDFISNSRLIQQLNRLQHLNRCAEVKPQINVSARRGQFLHRDLYEPLVTFAHAQNGLPTFFTLTLTQTRTKVGGANTVRAQPLFHSGWSFGPCRRLHHGGESSVRAPETCSSFGCRLVAYRTELKRLAVKMPNLATEFLSASAFVAVLFTNSAFIEACFSFEVGCFVVL
jgi:hypothetical protein